MKKRYLENMSHEQLIFLLEEAQKDIDRKKTYLRETKSKLTKAILTIRGLKETVKYQRGRIVELYNTEK
jgi:hypothetical protein